MTPGETFILRAALDGRKSIYRDIEIESSKSLYRLAEAITNAFDFDFDHAFGFYSGLTPAKLTRIDPRYELFADMGEADPGVFSVKKTKISQAFPAIGHALLFLFDYGDEWRFRVSLKEAGTKQPKVRYPRVVTIPHVSNIVSNNCFARSSPSCVKTTDFTLPTGSWIIPLSCKRPSTSQSKPFHAL
jgi:hypothetical protein